MFTFSYTIIGRDYIITSEEFTSHSIIERMVTADKRRAHNEFVRMCEQYYNITLEVYQVGATGDSHEVSTVTVTNTTNQRKLGLTS